MGLLPDIDENGGIIELTEKEGPKLYTPPKAYGLKQEEEEFARLQNLGHEKISKDFSDSPHLNT